MLMRHNRKIDTVIIETLAGQYTIGSLLEEVEWIKYRWYNKSYEIKTDCTTYIIPHDRILKLDVRYSEVY